MSVGVREKQPPRPASPLRNMLDVCDVAVNVVMR